MVSFIEKRIKRVAIIGGGPGGIAAARALRNEGRGTFETIVIYERNDHTGGTWKYSSETNAPPPMPSTNSLHVDKTLETHPLHSPIYNDLHTNLPHQVMCFQDFPILSTGYTTFLHHSQVMDYLSQLVEKENMNSMIQFHTLVQNVEFEKDVWKVSSKDLRTGEMKTEEFDAVVVATGHYAVPYVPDILGLKELMNGGGSIKILHSRDYRAPDWFKGKNVLVIGGGSSANDIVREVSTVATNVYQSIRTQTELSRQSIERNSPNVHQVDLIQSILHQDNNQLSSFVRLQNGQELFNIDTIIFGTGYLYSFPFLPFQKDNLIITGQKVHHLDHYMFYQENPTLCFLGLPIRVVPMPLMQRQAIVMARYWSGKIPMVPHQHTSTAKTTSNEDDRLEFIMGIAREFEYSEKLGAWAEGWINADIEQWHSDDLLTGRLTEEWKELRKNALALRREQLGY